MVSRKDERKDAEIECVEKPTDNDDTTLDGKGLHDLYRHTAKLIK